MVIDKGGSSMAQPVSGFSTWLWQASISIWKDLC